MKLNEILRFAGVWWLLGLSSLACGDTDSTVSSETNWFHACVSSDDCSAGSCQCGVCTVTCQSDASCADLENASCALDESRGHDAACGAGTFTEGICLPHCNGDSNCSAGQECTSGVCAPADLGAGGSNSTTTGNPSGSAGQGGQAEPCPGNPRSQCAVDCNESSYDCGSPNSTWDENGCVRAICYADEECGADERCGFLQGNEGGAPGESDACIAPFTCSEDEQGACVCGGPGVCAGYCVPR